MYIILMMPYNILHDIDCGTIKKQDFLQSVSKITQWQTHDLVISIQKLYFFIPYYVSLMIDKL